MHDLTFYHFGELNLKSKFMTLSFLNLHWASTVGPQFFVCTIALVTQTVKNSPLVQENWVRSLGWKIPWRRKQLPTLIFWPREFHGQRSLAGYSPWGCKELDMTEWLWLLLSVAFACSSLKHGLVSWPEIEVRPWQWEHWLLTTRPRWPVTRPWPIRCVEVNFHIEMESSETSKVFIRRKRAHVDRHMGGLRERVMPSQEFESL